MAENYFSKFPLISYSGKQCIDITKRIRVRSGERNSPYVYYPYEIPHGLRADHIASYYYEDGYLDWMIYLSNDLIDPYYDWYLDSEQFHRFIQSKYGDIPTAQRKIKYYQNNWENDDNELTPSFYNNTLPNSHKKYYSPVFGVNTKIISYRRKQVNSLSNTNRILQYTIANNSSNAYTVGELVNIRPSGTDETVGTGEIEMANSSVIRVKNVDGNTAANSSVTKDIIGVSTSTNATANSVETYFENFGNTETIFWTPVTYYDYETFKNEKKKNIKLVGDTIYSQLVNTVREQLNGNNTSG